MTSTLNSIRYSEDPKNHQPWTMNGILKIIKHQQVHCTSWKINMEPKVVEVWKMVLFFSNRWFSGSILKISGEFQPFFFPGFFFWWSMQSFDHDGFEGFERFRFHLLGAQWLFSVTTSALKIHPFSIALSWSHFFSLALMGSCCRTGHLFPNFRAWKPEPSYLSLSLRSATCRSDSN